MKSHAMILLCLLGFFDVNGQEILQNNLIYAIMPGKYEEFGGYSDDTAHVNAYKVLDRQGATKYLFYSMSNAAVKAEKSDLSVKNISFLEEMNADLQCSFIAVKAIGINGLTWLVSDVKFHDLQAKEAVGILYMILYNGRIYRILFMYPMIQFKDKYEEECKSIMRSLKIHLSWQNGTIRQ